MNLHATGGRPHRSTHGQGGAFAQLAVAAERIQPDLNPAAMKRTKTKDIPDNVPINAMAPLEKQCRGVRTITIFSTLSAMKILQAKAANILPVSDDPPLNLKAPKPLFSNAKNDSTFGFQSSAASRLPGVSENDWVGENGDDQQRSVDADEMDVDDDSHAVGLGMTCISLFSHTHILCQILEMIKRAILRLMSSRRMKTTEEPYEF